jgi:hypothetical protein
MIIDSIFDMTLGMFLGMAVSPLMMKAVRNLRERRKLNRILREISELRESNVHVD